MMEVNRICDCNGRIGLQQIIFWDWNGEFYEVVAWRILNPTMQPTYRWGECRYVSDWRENNKSYRVHAITFRETWTTWDPEIDNRELVPVCRRRNLK